MLGRTNTPFLVSKFLILLEQNKTKAIRASRELLLLIFTIFGLTSVEQVRCSAVNVGVFAPTKMVLGGSVLGGHCSGVTVTFFYLAVMARVVQLQSMVVSEISGDGRAEMWFGLQFGAGDGSMLPVKFSLDEVMTRGSLVILRKLPVAEQLLISCRI